MIHFYIKHEMYFTIELDDLIFFGKSGVSDWSLRLRFVVIVVSSWVIEGACLVLRGTAALRNETETVSDNILSGEGTADDKFDDIDVVRRLCSLLSLLRLFSDDTFWRPTPIKANDNKTKMNQGTLSLNVHAFFFTSLCLMLYTRYFLKQITEFLNSFYISHIHCSIS
jgi:hypothetical protein